jgi:penicillin-binding protein A
VAENKAQNTQKNTQKKDADSKKDARNRKRMGNQREIWLSAGSIGVLFLCLLVYLCHFVATSEQDMINNSYNSRQQILLSRNYRGSIYSRDGDVLAETILDADEEETRNYPYKNLFSHIVGYSTQGRMGVEALANYYLINTNTSLSNKVKNDTAGKKNPGDNVYTTLGVILPPKPPAPDADFFSELLPAPAPTPKVTSTSGRMIVSPIFVASPTTVLVDNTVSIPFNRDSTTP